MIKKLHIFLMAFLIGIFSMNAQTTEAGPYDDAPNSNNSEALFDLIEILDVGLSTGQQGLAGVIYFNDEYWVTRWNSALDSNIHRLDAAGNLIETFQIAGVDGARSITTDGTLFYIGTAGLEILIIDPVLKLLNGTITITTASDAEARMVTFDETLDGGSGGFWIGDFGSDIASVDMSGNELSVIPAGDHGTVIYGGAFDGVSPGGPYLWIHDQSGGAPNRDFVTQLALPSGIPTGVIYDFTTDGFNAGATEVLGGGLFITDEHNMHSGNALVGLCQCTPTNLVFTLELTPELGVNDNDISNFTLYPNPTNGSRVSIETSIAGEKQVAVFDVLGKMVINTVISDRELDISVLTAGIYMVQVTQNKLTATKKLIVR